MKNRLFVVILLLFLSIVLTGNAQATSVTVPNSTSLIVVHLDSSVDLDRFVSTQLPVFAWLDEALLTSADEADQGTLQSAGLRFEVVDQNPGSGTYYLAETRPSRDPIDFNLYGQVLFNTGRAVLLRMDSSRVEALTQAGAEISLVTLTPKSLPEAQAGDVFPQVIDPDPLIQQMIDQVQLSQVSNYDRQLAGELPVWVDGEWYTIPTRNTYSGTPIQKTTHFVGQHMANALGLDVEYHAWNNTTNPNVIGEMPGLVNPENIFIIGGHIDDVNGTPGADDNASGSVATLLAADILSQYEWGCTLRFAFWTGEEQGLLGSAAYALRASQSGENILGYLNLDMIAWNTIGSPPVINLFYTNNIPATLQLAQLFADVVDTYNLNLLPVLGTGVTGSDHYSFWQRGFNSILAIEDDLGGDFNPYYHGPGDTPAHTDLTYFTNFVKASIGTYAHMTGCLIPNGLGSLNGHVTDVTDGAPVGGAVVTAEDDQGHSFTASSDISGYYTNTLLSGSYTVTATAAGYEPTIVTDVTIITDELTTVDINLYPLGTVNGYVTDQDSGLPLADVTVAANYGTTTKTDQNGYYEMSLYAGSYVVIATLDDYASESALVNIVPASATRQDFTLQANIVFLPNTLEATVVLGSTAQMTARLENRTASPFNFALFDIPTGADILGGGLDSFGYTWMDSNEAGGPIYQWVDATDGTPLGLSNNGEANVTLPFTFSFYGTSSTSIRIGNNGGLLFNASAGDLVIANTSLNGITTNNLIVPFWDDLDADTGNVYYKSIGSAPYRVFVIEWYNRPHYSNVGNATFELLLYESTNNIKYQYQDVNFGNEAFNFGASATVGIRQNGSNYLQYSYDQSRIQDSMAICFTYPGSPNCSSNDVPWLGETPLSGTVPANSAQDITVVLTATDAAGVTAPGVYHANMLVLGDPNLTVPVVMTVIKEETPLTKYFLTFIHK